MSAQTAPETLIVFTTSPTGLGHIRVMDSLIDGLSPGSDYSIIGLSDINAAKIHALGSRIPIFLKITEFIQNTKILESLVTWIYKRYYSSRTKAITAELEKIKIDYPFKKRWIIISTHFALSYPVAAVKQKLSKKFNVEILNILIVTDDSPQKIWASDGCDFIFVPSEYTEEILRKYLPASTSTVIETVSFPVSPRLAVRLSESELELLEKQVDPNQDSSLHISVPVSGAAMQLGYLYELISTLSRDKFIFTAIGQLTDYSKDFFEKLKRLPRVQVSTGLDAQNTVKFYESSFFQGLRPACEITKPSEQAFKAILSPNQRGGVILLLTEPIGRQEKDNLNFLIRHELLANEVEQAKLEKYLLVDGKLPRSESHQIHYRASHWRALRLPKDPRSAAIFVKKAKEEELLYSMLSYMPEKKRDLTSDGVSQIWNTISEVIKYRSERQKLVLSE